MTTADEHAHDRRVRRGGNLSRFARPRSGSRGGDGHANTNADIAAAARAALAGYSALGPITPFASANMTSSARVSSRSFRMTFARCVSTVRTEMKSFFAISWFV